MVTQEKVEEGRREATECEAEERNGVGKEESNPEQFWREARSDEEKEGGRKEENAEEQEESKAEYKGKPEGKK